jgi:regulator of protease activity HflC (stomatin/prohibitin superfamily)
MGIFITALILLVIAIALFVVAKVKKFTYTEEKRYSDNITKTTKVPNRVLAGVGTILALVGILLLWNQSAYSQGVGEARVIRSWTGSIVGLNDKAGLAFKAPWDDLITYDILNKQAIFSNPANVHEDQKKDVVGGEITVSDKDGVTANVDVAVRYSIRPDKVVDIYTSNGDQKAFESKVVTQDMRAIVREVPNTLNTIDVITKRADLEAKIVKALQDRWESQGVQVNSVSLQDVRYPQSVTDAYAAAQNSRTAATKAQADLDAAKISAQQQVVSAQAQAQANEILSKSLTPEILQQRQLDVLSQFGAKGNAIVIQGGSGTPLIQVPSK